MLPTNQAKKSLKFTLNSKCICNFLLFIYSYYNWMKLHGYLKWTSDVQ
jgi:hypothetical protein